MITRARLPSRRRYRSRYTYTARSKAHTLRLEDHEKSSTEHLGIPLGKGLLGGVVRTAVWRSVQSSTEAE